MTRKRLPKAITRTSEDGRHATARTAPDQEAPPAPPASRRPMAAAIPAASLTAPPAASAQPASTTDAAETRGAERRAAARKIVERHRTYAALGGLFPLPVVNIAGVAAINMRMVKQLSDLYGVPFQQDRTRSMIIGLMGGAVPTGLGAATASTLGFVVPGGALFGLAVSAVTAGALTRGIGQVFVEHFETGATAAPPPPDATVSP
jgi:uncharacterized protein (DUF697 family)